MQGRTGVNVNTPGSMILDAGEIWLNIDEDAMVAAVPATDAWTDAIAGVEAVKLGATRGGNAFNLGRTLRQMPVDGVLGTPKGFVRRQTSQPTITTNLLEMTVANFRNAIAGAVEEVAGEFTKITGGPILEASYLLNVALATTYTGNPDLPIVVVIRNALVYEAPAFSYGDEDEAVIPVTFTGHLNVASPYEEPWAIYHPGPVIP